MNPKTRAQSGGAWFRVGETPRQAGMLFSAHTGSMAAGLLIGLIQARWMEPAELGRFAFCLAIIMIAGLFFELGVFPAGARVLALAEDPQTERRILGALVVLAAAIGAMFALFVAAAAAPIDLIFKKDVHWLLISVAGFAFFQPFQALVEHSCQGLNQIRKLSEFQLLTSAVYLLVLIVLVISNRLTAGSALAAYLLGIGLASFWCLARLRPSFRETRRYIGLALKEVRGYGLNMSVARITGAITVRVDNLILAYYLVDLAPLGLYAFAQKLSSPIIAMSRALAVSRFRAFAKLTRIPDRIKKWNTIVLVGGSAALVVAGPFALRLAFPKYSGAAPLLLPFAVWNLFAGLFQPYNSFMASHGRGKEVRNIAIIITLASLLGLVFTVPRFGVIGAAWTGAGVMALDYFLYLYYYHRFKRTLIERHGEQAAD